MSFLHPLSSECTKSELDLFSLPSTQCSIEKSSFVEYRPISTLSQGSIIEFNIAGDGETYLDLSESILHVCAKIVRSDLTDLDAAASATIVPTKLFLQSLFSQVDVYLNGKLVSGSSDTYAYKAYLETLLNYGHDAKNSQLTASMWDVDDADVSESKVIDLMGRLHADVFLQNKLLLNNVDLKIRLVPSKSTFCLNLTNQAAAGLAPKVHILEASLFMKRVRLTPTVLAAHISTLESGASVKYPFRRTEVKIHSIARGSPSVHIDNLFHGQVPTRVVLGVVAHEAVTGNYKKDPYDFPHLKATYVSLTVDGEEVFGKALQPDFENNQYIRAYFSLFTGTGTAFDDTGNCISRREYVNGSTLYAFDLTPDGAANCTTHVNLIKQGVVRLEMKFADPLGSASAVVAYGEFENLLEIDRSRNVTVDF